MSSEDDPAKKQLQNSNILSAGQGGGLQVEKSKKEMLEDEAMILVLQGMKDDYDPKLSQQEKAELKTRGQIAEENMTHKKRAIRTLRRKVKINDTFAAILALSGMVIALVEYNFYSSGDGSKERPSQEVYEVVFGKFDQEGWENSLIKTMNKTTPFTTVLRFVVSLSTAVLMIPIFFHMKLNFDLSIQSGKIKYGSSMIKSKHFRTFLIEVFINLIHCPPYLDYEFIYSSMDFPIRYSLDLILANLMLLRIYLALRLFSLYTKWRSELAMKYCEMEGCEASTGFAMKASLQENPYLSLLLAFMLSALILGIPVSNFEIPMNELQALVPDGSPLNFSLWNGIWLIVITMTTVGFGDFYARTHPGRFASVLSIFWGIFLTSMMVVTLTNSFSLDSKETRAFNILYRLKARRNLMDKATFMVTLIVRLRSLATDVERRLKNLDPKKPSDEAKINEMTQKFEDEKTEIYAKLDIVRSQFNEADSHLQSAEDDPVEEIRKLSLSIESDFNKMRNFFIAVKEIEANLLCIQKSHEIIEKIVDETAKYCLLFNKEIIQFKGGIFDIKKAE